MSNKKRSQSVKISSIRRIYSDSQKEEDFKVWQFVSSRIRAPFDAPVNNKDSIRVFREDSETWKDFVYLYDAEKSPEHYAKRFDKFLVPQLGNAPLSDHEKLNLFWALGLPITREFLDKVKISHKVKCDSMWFVIDYKGMDTIEEWPDGLHPTLIPIDDYCDDFPSDQFKRRVLERERDSIRARSMHSRRFRKISVPNSRFPTSPVKVRARSTIRLVSRPKYRPPTPPTARNRIASCVSKPKSSLSESITRSPPRLAPSPNVKRRRSAKTATTPKRKASTSYSEDSDDDIQYEKTSEMEAKMWDFLNEEIRDPVTDHPRPFRIFPMVWQKLIDRENYAMSFHKIHQIYLKTSRRLHLTDFSLQMKIELYWALQIVVDKEFLKILQKSYDLTMDRKGFVQVYSEKKPPVDEYEVQSETSEKPRASEEREVVERVALSPVMWQNINDTDDCEEKKVEVRLLDEKPTASYENDASCSVETEVSRPRNLSELLRERTVDQEPLYIVDDTPINPIFDWYEADHVQNEPFTQEEETEMWKYVRRHTRAPSVNQLRKFQLNEQFWVEFKNGAARRTRSVRAYMTHFRNILLPELHNAPFSGHAKIELYFVLDCHVDLNFIEIMERTHICNIDTQGRLRAFEKKTIYEQSVWWPAPELMWEYILDECTDSQGNVIIGSVDMKDLNFWKNLNHVMNLGKNAEKIRNYFERTLLPNVSSLDLPATELLAIFYCFQIPVTKSLMIKARQNFYCVRISKENIIEGYKYIKSELGDEEFEVPSADSKVTTPVYPAIVRKRYHSDDLPDLPTAPKKMVVDCRGLLSAFRSAVVTANDRSLDGVLDHVDRNLGDYNIDGKTISSEALNQIFRNARNHPN